jgi:sporulation protein YlmC with PRC-barrel domain
MGFEGQKLCISDVLNCRIVTAEGKIVGHVADVELTPGPEYRLIALLFGPRAWLHRLHILNPFTDRSSSAQKPDRVPWEAVAHVKHPIITLKPGYEPEKHGIKDVI